MDPRRQREIFMNIPAARGQLEQSFEESRISDYLNAYTTTGGPPQPCPPLPLHPADRTRLGLPPLFHPYVEVAGQPFAEDPLALNLELNGSVNVGNGAPVQDLNTLPEVQMFTATDITELGQAVHLQSIVAQKTFDSFSPEELRYQAYRTGKKTVPVVIPNMTVPSLVVTPPTNAAIPDQLQSITSLPSFEKHSFEELHLVYRRTGRELTSEQILQMSVI